MRAIKELQEHAKELAQILPEITVEQRMLFLLTEVGEVAREVLRLSRSVDQANADTIKADLGMEMYDVIWNICDLANMLDIDLETSFAAKIEINKTRKWHP
ncbi:MAG: MazG nucleotide pyrophosphohydrolase domain-containing protein [Roseiflexaceae bacterium]